MIFVNSKKYIMWVVSGKPFPDGPGVPIHRLAKARGNDTGWYALLSFKFFDHV